MIFNVYYFGKSIGSLSYLLLDFIFKGWWLNIMDSVLYPTILLKSFPIYEGKKNLIDFIFLIFIMQ